MRRFLAVMLTVLPLWALLPSGPATAAVAPAFDVAYPGPFYFETRRPAPVTATATYQGSALAGQRLTFTYGSGGGDQTCTAVTDSHGIAACTLKRIAPPDGPQTLKVLNTPSSAWRTSGVYVGTIAYAYLPDEGLVVGDVRLSPFPAYAIDQSVVVRSPGWADANPTSESGTVSTSFHGLQTSDSEPKCGGSWKVTGTASAQQPLPDPLPSYVITAVTSKVKTVESAGTVVVSGNITHVVVVHLDAPASDGTLTGTVAGILC